MYAARWLRYCSGRSSVSGVRLMDIKGLLEDEDFKEKLSALAGALTVLSETPARKPEPKRQRVDIPSLDGVQYTVAGGIVVDD